MHHIAIMRKSWKLTEKILSGKKKIESRWYMNRSAPWNKICAGEKIFFKDSGEPVSIQADVEKVLQFENLTPEKVKEILREYGGEGKICVSNSQETFERNKSKKYCMLIFLKKPRAIEPFEINKKGFGIMSAWICVDNVEKIRKYTGTSGF